MSASEKLKALAPADLPLTASAELIYVFPQIVAVVEAAERYRWPKDYAVLAAALAALDEALS